MSTTNEDLCKAWTETRVGQLSVWSQAKVWALREVWREDNESEHGLCTLVARKVKKHGGGHPSGEAIMKLYKKMDADPDWFPGKIARSTYGPSPLLTPSKSAVIAQSAMIMKRNGSEPTYARVLAACPTATINPATKKPFSKKRVHKAFRERCHDAGAQETWVHKAR